MEICKRIVLSEPRCVPGSAIQAFRFPGMDEYAFNTDAVSSQSPCSLPLSLRLPRICRLSTRDPRRPGYNPPPDWEGVLGPSIRGLPILSIMSQSPALCQVQDCGVLAIGRCLQCSKAFCESHRAISRDRMIMTNLCTECWIAGEDARRAALAAEAEAQAQAVREMVARQEDEYVALWGRTPHGSKTQPGRRQDLPFVKSPREVAAQEDRTKQLWEVLKDHNYPGNEPVFTETPALQSRMSRWISAKVEIVQSGLKVIPVGPLPWDAWGSHEQEWDVQLQESGLQIPSGEPIALDWNEQSQNFFYHKADRSFRLTHRTDSPARLEFRQVLNSALEAHLRDFEIPIP
jgi:hypothetical protein